MSGSPAATAQAEVARRREGVGERALGEQGVVVRDQLVEAERLLHVRRSWIESYLTLGKELELAFQYDFAEPNRPINDAVGGCRSRSRSCAPARRRRRASAR
jgi:hypothetical protein